VVYDGGVLSAEDAAAIRLAEGELAGLAFVGRDEVPELVTPLLSRRIAACLGAAEAGSVAALENGSLWPG
jgi:8-oxo-dGTP diphosphatase